MRGAVMLAGLLCLAAGAAEPRWWDAPDRGAKVAALIPGRRLVTPTPETLFAAQTAALVTRWQAEHPALSPDEAWRQYTTADPADAALVADFPTHLAPFGRPRSGRPTPQQVQDVLYSWCPFCGSRTLAMQFDAQNPWHATTSCCRRDLYGREHDWPAGDPLKPSTTVRFRHLDDQLVDVPCTLFRDRNGVEWELFIGTIFAQRRWLTTGCDRVVQLARQFEETGNPLFAHKVAVLLDRVAETYYGLPLVWRNEFCGGQDQQGLTRAEWEAVPRPAIFEVGPLGPWNRRTPNFNRGWLNMSGEHLWVEPFALVRHHPAFQEYSRRTYGDPQALDQKVRTKLLREIALMFKSVFGQKLLTNYQEANYVTLWLLGVLLQDRELLDFAGPNQELTVYNHTYQDGLNGEGAPNYMAMPGAYFYPYLADPQGWLRFQPTFLEDNPFYHAAAGELRRLDTVRGLQVEFGDQHEHAFAASTLVEAAAVREREQRGSRNWAGYGVGILRVGGPGHRQEVGLSYTRATLHNAQDALGIECWVDGVPVMRRGGYAAHWYNAPLQWERPEYQALRRMGYPHELEEAPQGFGSWSWLWAHSALCQNTVTVNEAAPGGGWGDNRGYGEVLTFKGGEPAGAPGAGFQVLDVRDHYTFARVGQEVSDFRRTLIGIEGPDGRPYVLDLLKLVGGRRHLLHQSAVAERAEAALPAPTAQSADLAAHLCGAKPPGDRPEYQNFGRVRHLQRTTAPTAPWSVTWRTDAAQYAPRELDGTFRRPWPADLGRVRLRLTGLPVAPGPTELLSGQGPWIGWLKQPLANGQRVDGNVAFVNARDFLIESRTAAGDAPLASLFVHVLEGYREGEAPAIRQVTALPLPGVAGDGHDQVALRLEFAGHTDTVVYQSAPGTVRLADGLETDACYALLRRAADGTPLAAEAVRGTYLRAGDFRLQAPGDLTGVLDDVVGDLTGTRRESALILRPDRPWPAGASLHDRQLLVRYESPLRDACHEGWRVDRTSLLPDGRVRVDVQDAAPFAVSWHQVTVLPADRPNVIRTNRPLVDHGNTPWYHGLTLWFPERGRSYTIQKVNEVGGGYGGDTVELVSPANLATDGIKLGDWFVIHGLRPGLQVNVAGDFSWRRAPGDGAQYALAGTGDLVVESPATRGRLAWRAGSGPWQEATGQTTFPAVATAGRGVRLLADRPAWLRLDDDAPPEVALCALDGRPVAPEAARDLGTIDAPRRWTVTLRDAANPLDLTGLTVTWNGAAVPAASLQATPAADGREVAVTVDLASLLGPDADRPRRQRFELTVTDRSVDRHRTTVTLAFVNRVPLDPRALYLSDLPPVRALAHGGLLKDRDYVGNVIDVAGVAYAKGLTLCPENAPGGGAAEVVYQVPPDRQQQHFRAEVGISSSARANGSVGFIVETGPAADGPWTARFTSLTLRGGQPAVAVDVALEGAAFLRLRTTDGGDTINSDHAVWAGARLR